jgi:hypothetical protein
MNRREERKKYAKKQWSTIWSYKKFIEIINSTENLIKHDDINQNQIRKSNKIEKKGVNVIVESNLY